MKLVDGKTYIESILNREFQGARITPQEYNLYISAILPNFIKYRIELYTQQLNQNNKEVFVSLKAFDNLLIVENVNFTNGVFSISNLSNSYLIFSGAYCILNNKQYNIRLVSIEEFKDRMINLKNPAVEINPIMTVINDSFYIIPRNINSMTLYYYRKPSEVYLDYYIRNGRIRYLDEGVVVNLQAGDILSDGTVLTSSLAYQSKTRELVLNEDLHYEFFNELLRNIAMKFKEGDVYSHTVNIKQEENML